MPEWQDEPTEGGWYWYRSLYTDRPRVSYFLKDGDGKWQNVARCPRITSVMPIPEPDDA